MNGKNHAVPDNLISSAFALYRENEGDFDNSEGEISEKGSNFSSPTTEDKGVDEESACSTVVESGHDISDDENSQDKEEVEGHGGRKSYKQLLSENEQLRQLIDSKTEELTRLEENYQVILEENKLISKKFNDIQKSANDQVRNVKVELQAINNGNACLEKKVEKMKTGIKELNGMLFEAILQLNCNGNGMAVTSSSSSLAPTKSVVSNALVPLSSKITPVTSNYSAASTMQSLSTDWNQKKSERPLAISQMSPSVILTRNDSTRENEGINMGSTSRNHKPTSIATQIHRCLESIPPLSHCMGSERTEVPSVNKIRRVSPKKKCTRVLHDIDRQRQHEGFFCTCGIGVSSRSGLLNHIKYHTFQKRFRCTVLGCGNRYFCTAQLRNHMKAQHDILYTGREGCRQCGKTFLTRKQLQWHSKNAHNTGPCRPRSKNTPKIPYSSPCASALSSERTSSLEKSKSERQGDKADKKESRPRSYSRLDLSLFQMPHKMDLCKGVGIDGHVSCVCGRHFAAKRYLIMHIKYYAFEPKFICKECGKLFSYFNNLRIHLRSAHEITFEGNSGCRICGRIFRTRMAFNQHCKTAHTGRSNSPNQESPGSDHKALPSSNVTPMERSTPKRNRKAPAKYILESEESVPARSQSYNRISQHAKGQNRDNPGPTKNHANDWNCPDIIKCTCGLTFPSQARLINHIKLTENINQQKHFQDDRFKRAQSGSWFEKDACHKVGFQDLKNQIFKCTCGSQFASQTLIREHIQWKLGKCMFSCHVCNETFWRHDYMKLHLRRVHSLELPAGMYCRICGKGGFSSANEIKIHRRIHNNLGDGQARD